MTLWSNSISVIHNVSAMHNVNGAVVVAYLIKPSYHQSVGRIDWRRKRQEKTENDVFGQADDEEGELQQVKGENWTM